MSEEEGKPLAFCPLLWHAGGGVFNASGGPHTNREFLRGVCTRPSDCDTCIYFQNELTYHDHSQVTWVCPSCLDTVYSWSTEHGVSITVPGFYSEGPCEYPWCNRPQDETLGQPAKYSSFRQIVFGPIR